MLKAIILDMDGTMMDTERAAALEWPQVGKVFGFEVTSSFINYFMGLTGKQKKERIQEMLPDRSDTEEIIAYLYQSVKARIKNEGVAAKPGLTELIHYCKSRNLILAVASSSPVHRIEELLGNHGLLQYFDLIIGGDLVTRHKPDKEIYDLAAARLNLTHTEVMVIEDSRVGLAAAYAADMKVILVPDVEAPDEVMLSQCEACVSSLKEAIPVIEGQLSRDRLWSVNEDAS